MSKGPRRPRHAVPGALVAPLLGALLILGAPAATYAAPRQPPGNPPPAGSGEGHGAHSGHADRPDPNDGRSDKAKDPHAGNSGSNDKNQKSPDRGAHSGGHDAWYGHYDHQHYGYHGHHNWDTHRRYYRYGYAGPGWYDDCGYYGANGDYESPDACDWQYGTQGRSLRADLSGDQEVPGPGAPNSFGTANLFADVPNGRLCYRLGYDGIDQATMGHIHRGGPGQTGQPVIDLRLDANGDEGCVPADPAVLQSVQDHPEDFYLNVHAAQYPDGAMRGQLFDTDRH
jgi:hypothetical protein